MGVVLFYMYSQIDANKRKTFFLMAFFAVLLLAIGYFFSYYYNSLDFLIIALVISLGMNLASYFAGDKIALMTAGAEGPLKQTDNPYVYRLVENLAITAGLPLPKIYLIPDSFPNAFATGRDPNHATIALTTGLIESLENEELEGVIAHELSHIKNYDIRLMMVIIVLVGLVTLAVDMLWRSKFFGRKNSSEKTGGQLGGILMIVGLILVVLSPIIAQLMQLAISRKREFLADADGALITRYPEGLARALEKINAYKLPMKKATNATAHLYLANPFGAQAGKGLAKLFSTHPPIEQRIKELRAMV